MIAEMTTTALISYSPMATRGASELAHFVAQQSAAGRSSLQDSFYFGFNLQEVLNELYAVAEECKSANWDGQGAAAVSDESYRAAYKFLEALPLGAVAPSAGVEPDGEMTLEWYHSPRRTLSISFSKNGELHYAALIGASKVYGTEPFFGEVPQIITGLVSRVNMA
ncbi:MAG: hypothetical protein KGJ60_11135 [Verrucomicrobiota bacterium]|nr:hypothetical protein [Verrucomicrobiota bacterium]